MALDNTSKTIRKFVVEGVIIYKQHGKGNAAPINIKVFIDGTDMIDAIYNAHKQVKHDLQITEVREYPHQYERTEAVGFAIETTDDEEEEDDE